MDVVFAKDHRQDNPVKKFFKGLFAKLKTIKIPNTFYYFLILIAVGVGFYMLMLVENAGTLAYGGDYSAQYIPMGYHIWDYYHEWIKTGHFTLFDPELYLGVNSIGSNAYYGLFSPFNIIIVIFPREFVPQSLAICSIVKLAFAGLFFSIYMKKAFKVKENVSYICGIAYAFCGWGAFYLWYNNYQDILVFFPLVLLGIEKTLQENKPWLLAVGIFLLTICNYVLMVPYIICAFFYAMFRFFQQIKGHSVKENFIKLGLGASAFLGGLCMALFVFAPAFMATVTSPKLDSYSYIGVLKDYLFKGDFANFFKLLFSWTAAPDQHNRIIPNRVYYPILEFFFPATTCRSLPTLELSGWDFDDMAVSLWCYVPFIMFLVPALIQSGKEKKWSHFICFGLLVLTLFTPFMYFLTMGMTNGYARWTLFIATSLIAYVGIYIDKIPNVARWHMHVGFTFAVLGIIAAWIITYRIVDPSPDPEYGKFIFRLSEDGVNYTNYAFLGELAYVTVQYLVLLFLYNKKSFHILMTIFVCAEAVVVGNFVSYGHGWDTRYNNGYALNEKMRKIVNEIEKEDQTFHRYYTSMGDAYSVNNSFIGGYNSVSFFHSLYNFEIDDFTMWTGLRNGTKSVSGDYRGKYQDLDNLLGVKYYITSPTKNKYAAFEQTYPGLFIDNVPFDFNKREDLSTDDFFVYDNQSLNDFGYSYDTLYTGGLATDCRFDRKAIDQQMILATDAVVKEEDAQEITQNYPDINIDTEKPSTATLRDLYLNTDYYRYYYDLNSIAKYYPFEKITNIPNDFEATSFDNDKVMNYFVFYTSLSTTEPLFYKDTSIYVRAPFSNSQKYDFYFIDGDNNIFMYDCHDDSSTDNTCYMRGFYIRKNVYKLAICAKYGQSYLYDSTLRFAAESRHDYEVRRDALNADPIENVKYSQDRFTFSTNYTQDKFVVSRTAYDQGWSIRATNQDTQEKIDIKVYKGNGGFVSFVAPKGNYTYEMTYMTPYLKGSYIISALTTGGFFISLLAYHLYFERKRPHLDNIYREN